MTTYIHKMLPVYVAPVMEPMEDPSELHPSLSVNPDQDIHEMYKKAEASFWTIEEILVELAKDHKDWVKLSPAQQYLIKDRLAFFAASDFYVNETIVEQIRTRVQCLSWWRWEDYKVMVENTHNEVYGKLVEEYISDPTERREILDAVQFSPSVQRKINWMHKWVGKNNQMVHLDESKQLAIREMYNTYIKHQTQSMTSLGISETDLEKYIPDHIKSIGHELAEHKIPLSTIVLINAIVEGIFFSGSFCVIFWFQEQGLMPGLSMANEWISRDEGLHTCFAIMVYRYKLVNKLDQSIVHEIIREAVDIEQESVCDAIPGDMLGMNSRLMTQYIQFTADQMLVAMGLDKIWDVDNPFPFMEKQSIGVRMSDFFKRTPSAYGHHASGLTAEEMKPNFDEDF